MVSKPKQIGVSLKLGVVELSGVWEPDESERRAAWEMYVELITRISVVPLPKGQGLLREALNSLYSLFPTTRDILRRYGPTVAQPKKGGELSFAAIAVAVLNHALRPLLTRWHPELSAYEATRASDVAIADHERSWESEPELRAAIEEVRHQLADYSDKLAEAADVPVLSSAQAPIDGESRG